MAVHDVAMNPISASGLNAMDFVTESGEIGGENGWSDDDLLHVTTLRRLERLQGRCVFAVGVITLVMRSVSNLSLDGAPHCFMLRVSGWPNRAAGKDPTERIRSGGGTRLFGLESAANKYSCSTDLSAGYPATSGSISGRRTLLFTSRIKGSFCVSLRSWPCRPVPTGAWQIGRAHVCTP